MARQSTRQPKSPSAKLTLAAARLPQDDTVGTFRAQHMETSLRRQTTETGVAQIVINDSESPLAWLARRKGRDGRAMIGPEQFMAGERLRADFTRGHMTPRVTSSWSVTGRTNGAGGGGEIADIIVAARQRVRLALEACGPEFSGLLLDICCFLRGLEDVERERGWPSRSAKIVLQLALDRLARHYGVQAEARGTTSLIQTWLADDAKFTV